MSKQPKYDPEKIILSILLHATLSDCRKILSLISNQWISAGINRFVFDAISDLSQSGNETNLLTVINYFKQNNKTMPKGYSVIDISKMSSEMEWYMQNWDAIQSVIHDLKENFDKKTLLQAAAFISTEITKDVMNAVDMSKQLEKAILSVQSNDLMLSNENIRDTALNVIKSHNEAKKGNISGIELGFNSTYRKILIESSDLIVIGARPSMGKTAFALTLVYHFAFKMNLKLKFFSLEMSKEQITRRLISIVSEVSGTNLKFGTASENQIDKVYKCLGLEGWQNIEIIEGAKDHAQINREIALGTDSGVQIVIVDYLQKVKAVKSTKRYEAVTEVSGSLKDSAMTNKVPIIALAQVGRNVAKEKARPTLADIRNSGDIEQDADTVLFLHREDYYGVKTNEAGENMENTGEIIIAKNREGFLDIIEMDINPINLRWIDKGSANKVEFIDPMPKNNFEPNVNFEHESGNDDFPF